MLNDIFDSISDSLKHDALVEKNLEQMNAEVEFHKKLDFFDKRTNFHIDLVKKAAEKVATANSEFKEFDGTELCKKCETHDASKFDEPEKTPYVELTWNKNQENQKEVSPDLQKQIIQATLHHVTSNEHHPEYWNKEQANLDPKDRDKSVKVLDASKMPSIAIAEMVCDWQAMSDELKTNTAREWWNKVRNVRWSFTPEQEDLIDRLLKVFEAEEVEENNKGGYGRYYKVSGKVLISGRNSTKTFYAKKIGEGKYLWSNEEGRVSEDLIVIDNGNLFSEKPLRFNPQSGKLESVMASLTQATHSSNILMAFKKATRPELCGDLTEELDISIVSASHNKNNVLLVWWYNIASAEFRSSNNPTAQHCNPEFIDIFNDLENRRSWVQGRVFRYGGKIHLMVYMFNYKTIPSNALKNLLFKIESSLEEGESIDSVFDEKGNNMSDMFESKTLNSSPAMFGIKEEINYHVMGLDFDTAEVNRAVRLSRDRENPDYYHSDAGGRKWVIRRAYDNNDNRDGWDIFDVTNGKDVGDDTWVDRYQQLQAVKCMIYHWTQKKDVKESAEEDIQDLINVQKNDPFTKQSPYMAGLTNGLVVAKACVTGEEVKDDLVNCPKPILVLEDDLNRIKKFRELLKDYQVTYTDQADIAIQELNTKDFSLIFLDHDLGGRVFVDSNEPNTGYQVAKAIPGSRNAETPVIVHSLNPGGGDRMVRCSPSTMSRIPFMFIPSKWEEIKNRFLSESIQEKKNKILFSVHNESIGKDIVLHYGIWYGHILEGHPQLENYLNKVKSACESIQKTNLWQTDHEVFTSQKVPYLKPYGDYLKIVFEDTGDTLKVITAFPDDGELPSEVKTYGF